MAIEEIVFEQFLEDYVKIKAERYFEQNYAKYAPNLAPEKSEFYVNLEKSKRKLMISNGAKDFTEFMSGELFK